MTFRVIVAGGGTAGHIEPALNTADAIKAAYPDAIVTALGTPKGLESTLVPARGYELDLIEPVPLPRKPSKDAFSFPLRLRRAVKSTAAVLQRRQPDVVVGFGGYAALPAYLAARTRVPIVVHEANAKAGLANKVGARFTSYVAETHPGSLPHAQLIGLPLRASITELDRLSVRTQARAHFGLPEAGPVLLVFGGSQGARHINTAVLEALPELSAAGVAVLHAVGNKNLDQLVTGIDGVVSVAYIDRMDLAYAAADLAVCRAGAMTVAELAAVGLPAVYVPLAVGNGEQQQNALALVTDGGGLLVANADFTASYLREQVLGLMVDAPRLDRMSQQAHSHGDQHAAQRLAVMVFQASERDLT